MRVFREAFLPAGFQAQGIASGIKRSGKPDLALLYSLLPARASCCFTSNRIQAAPLLLCKKHLAKSGFQRAIVINSGNANCFTGREGLRNAGETARAAARELGIKKEEVLIASTGIIGKQLPFKKIKAALPALAATLSAQGIHRAKRAILTTDTFAKEITARFSVRGSTVTVSGIAKGAGMIAPNMATMLAFILTDAGISKTALRQAVLRGVETTFNCITVDGCMSTNDSVMALANGASVQIGAGSRHYQEFCAAFEAVCLGLAKMIVQDAEGSTKFIEIEVGEAKSFEEARTVALGIANSSLFKCAMYGENPNFGRIAAAAGAAGIDVRERDLSVKVSPLSAPEIRVKVALKRGKAKAVVYTSDLTPEYVKINAAYT